ncbi:RBBP9/YdeN family alpha/beta hydrolase [Sulfurovum mangrovi]|uniref:RBBP9/YdeN family alpha/beta hydrolase n=1 Tax=Sulfurovum mangrovi TaxID=2893889 RepID=UPI001E3EB331|nr:alpha/beta hydrolase [Sulfurovum mangrovi]UFH59412.1 alpha/beta hydrolase [Sulfurovum mangrovi]
MRTLILHGWGGSDAPHWQAELAAEIAKNYGTVSFPLLDNCHFPSKNRWIKQVKQLIKAFNPDTVVCHSLANTLWFWLCEEEDMSTVERLFMVSPPSLDTEEKTIKSFFPAPMPNDLHAKEVRMIVSDNDPWITVDEAQKMASRYDIPLSVIENAGHINADSGYGKWEWIEHLVMEKQ